MLREKRRGLRIQRSGLRVQRSGLSMQGGGLRKCREGGLRRRGTRNLSNIWNRLSRRNTANVLYDYERKAKTGLSIAHARCCDFMRTLGEDFSLK